VSAGHRHTTHEHEHEFEAAHGLPAPLPPGETLLWQGAPDWRLLARHAFHVRKLVGYFGLILGLRIALHLAQGESLRLALGSSATLALLAAAAVGMAALMGWLASRSTVYTVTDRRVVMRVGVVLTVTFNIPFKRIEAAALHRLESGAGDIALSVDTGTRIAYAHLWPHARPWRLKRTEPMLRCVPDASEVARLLVDAWTASRGEAARPLPATTPVPARQPELQPLTLAH
jgi:hypothetical protein